MSNAENAVVPYFVYMLVLGSYLQQYEGSFYLSNTDQASSEVLPQGQIALLCLYSAAFASSPQ
jgi:hypothetical protein